MNRFRSRKYGVGIQVERVDHLHRHGVASNDLYFGSDAAVYVGAVLVAILRFQRLRVRRIDLKASDALIDRRFHRCIHGHCDAAHYR